MEKDEKAADKPAPSVRREILDMFNELYGEDYDLSMLEAKLMELIRGEEKMTAELCRLVTDGMGHKTEMVKTNMFSIQTAAGDKYMIEVGKIAGDLFGKPKND